MHACIKLVWLDNMLSISPSHDSLCSVAEIEDELSGPRVVEHIEWDLLDIVPVT